MAVFFIAIIAIGGIGIISYYTSAWFGCRASNTDKLPPHYQRLMERYERKKERERLHSSAKSRSESYSDEVVK